MTYRRLVVAWSLVLWAAAAATADMTVTAISTYWAARMTGRALDTTPRASTSPGASTSPLAPTGQGAPTTSGASSSPRDSASDVAPRFSGGSDKETRP